MKEVKEEKVDNIEQAVNRKTMARCHLVLMWQRRTSNRGMLTRIKELEIQRRKR
jgi:hypothetical protein